MLFIVKKSLFCKINQKITYRGPLRQLVACILKNFTTFFIFVPVLFLLFRALKTLILLGLFAPKKESAIFLISCNFVFFQKVLFIKNIPTKGLRPTKRLKRHPKGHFLKLILKIKIKTKRKNVQSSTPVCPKVSGHFWSN